MAYDESNDPYKKFIGGTTETLVVSDVREGETNGRTWTLVKFNNLDGQPARSGFFNAIDKKNWAAAFNGMQTPVEGMIVKVSTVSKAGGQGRVFVNLSFEAVNPATVATATPFVPEAPKVVGQGNLGMTTYRPPTTGTVPAATTATTPAATAAPTFTAEQLAAMSPAQIAALQAAGVLQAAPVATDNPF